MRYHVFDEQGFNLILGMDDLSIGLIQADGYNFIVFHEDGDHVDTQKLQEFDESITKTYLSFLEIACHPDFVQLKERLNELESNRKKLFDSQDMTLRGSHNSIKAEKEDLLNTMVTTFKLNKETLLYQKSNILFKLSHT